MRINQVEELVGITKKNIRFYEEKGLLTPKRNTENGYREYSDEDVTMLQKIKLLRQLAIPIEEILHLQQGYLTLEDCMKRHIIFLNREEENLRHSKAICSELTAANQQLSSLDAQKYLILMNEMEKDGVRFMNVKLTDKRRTAPIVVTIIMLFLMLSLISILIWASTVDSIPLPVLIFLILFPLLTIGGVLLALKERMKQIEGGEEDAASHY